MREVHRWTLGLLVAMVTASGAVAQPVPALATTADGARIFEELVRVFEEELSSASHTGPYLGAAAELRAMMYAGAANLGLTAVEADERGKICAYLVGGGGNPRLDGGGDLLAQRSPSEFPGSMVVRIGNPPGPMADRWPQPGRRIVILDEFDLTSLATSIRGLIDVHGEIPIQPQDASPSGLWAALYGYLVALEGPAVLPSEVSVPHGHLVAFHALANLGPDGRITGVVLDRPPYHGFRRAILTVSNPSGSIEVHLVALDFEDLQGIGEALKGYISHDADSVVTSWGFVDCALKERFDEAVQGGSSTAATIAEFWEEVFEASGEVESLLQQLCTAFEDPMTRVLQGPPNCGSREGLVGLATVVMMADVSARSADSIGWNPDGATRYFASAGNQGLAIPMPPAAWPGVHGVEACVVPNPSAKAWFSNAGAVGSQSYARALGAWFGPPGGAGGLAGGQSRSGYWGTSFAAPTVAVIASASPGLEGSFFFDPCVSP